jgi:hypothetical protein
VFLGLVLPFTIVCCACTIKICKHQANKDLRMRANAATHTISFINPHQQQPYVVSPYFSNQVYPGRDNSQNKGYNPNDFIPPPPSYENVISNQNNIKY